MVSMVAASDASVAWVGVVGTLSGAVVAGLLAVILDWQRSRREGRAHWRDERRELYAHFLEYCDAYLAAIHEMDSRQLPRELGTDVVFVTKDRVISTLSAVRFLGGAEVRAAAEDYFRELATSWENRIGQSDWARRFHPASSDTAQRQAAHDRFVAAARKELSIDG